jgi:hypothetical protein
MSARRETSPEKEDEARFEAMFERFVLWNEEQESWRMILQKSLRLHFPADTAEQEVRTNGV